MALNKAVENLTREFAHKQRSNSLSSVKQLDKAISNYISQLNEESYLPRSFLSSNPNELAKAINNLSELEATKEIALPLARFTGHVKNSQVSTNKVNDLRDSIERLRQSIAPPNNSQTLQEALLESADYFKDATDEISASSIEKVANENDYYYNRTRVHNDSEMDKQIQRAHDQEFPDFLNRQQQLYRLAYLDLARRVRQLPELTNASPETVDTAIAIAVLGQSNDYEEVARILGESDSARRGRKESSAEEGIARLSQYIEEICAEATKLLARSKRCPTSDHEVAV